MRDQTSMELNPTCITIIYRSTEVIYDNEDQRSDTPIDDLLSSSVDPFFVHVVVAE